MRAMVLRGPAPIASAPLQLTEIPRPEPGPGEALLRLAAEIPLHASTEEFPLEQANEALFRLRHDQIAGAEQ